MAIKVVQGLVTKSGTEQYQAQDAQQQQNLRSPSAGALATSLQNSIGKALQSNEAVVTTIRTVRGQSSSGSTRPVKDENEALEIAKEVSEKIREGSDNAFLSHEGLNSSKSSAVLLN